MLMRPEISQKSKYWIEKHRYYELKHFCLQYPLWKKTYESLDGTVIYSYDLALISNTNVPGDPTGNCVDLRSLYLDRMKSVEQAAINADPYIASYILKAVTEGYSYTYLKSTLNIPCGRDMYYDRCRRFFWILDKLRK